MYSCNRPGDSFFSMALSYIEVGRVAASASTSIKSPGEYQNEWHTNYFMHLSCSISP